MCIKDDSGNIRLTTDEFRKMIYGAGLRYGLTCTDEVQSRLKTEYGLNIEAELVNDGYEEFKEAISKLDIQIIDTK